MLWTVLSYWVSVGLCGQMPEYKSLSSDYGRLGPSQAQPSSYSHKCEDCVGADLLTNGSEDDVDDGSWWECPGVCGWWWRLQDSEAGAGPHPSHSHQSVETNRQETQPNLMSISYLISQSVSLPVCLSVNVSVIYCVCPSVRQPVLSLGRNDIMSPI